MFVNIFVYLYVLVALPACNGQSTVCTEDTATCDRRIVAYEEVVLRLLEQNAKLTDRLNAQQDEIRQLSQGYTDQQEEMRQGFTDMEATSQQQTEDIASLQRQLLGEQIQVAFTARKTSGWQQLETGDEIITFDDVQLNQGNGYSPSSSKFTCPVTGVYFFCSALYSLTNSAYLNRISGGKLVKNGEEVVGAWQENTDSDGAHASHTSICAAVSANKDDQVWVKAGWTSSNFYAYSDTDYESSFTGFLIQRTDI